MQLQQASRDRETGQTYGNTKIKKYKEEVWHEILNGD